MQDKRADLERLRSELVERMAVERYADAELVALQIIALEPDDIQALNCLGKLHKDRGDKPSAIDFYQCSLVLDPANRIANSQLERLGLATEHNALGRPRHDRAETGETTWTFADAFPHVVDAIDRLYARSYGWVPWAAIRDELLEDATALLDLDEWSHRQGKSAFKVASDIMAGWNRSITSGRNDYEHQYERRDTDYAMRPRER